MRYGERITCVAVMIIMVVMMLWCGMAFADTESGNFNGMDWSFDTETGVLLLGNGGVQDLTVSSTIDMSGWPWHDFRDSIVEVQCNGIIMVHNTLKGMFCQTKNLVSADLSGLDISDVTSLTGGFINDGLFYGCSKLVSLNVSGWDTSHIVNMGYLFSGCSSLSTLDLSSWDTSNVTRMAGMFNYCTSLTSLNISGFDTSNVTDMSSMFSACESMESIPVDLLDVSKVTKMSGMFYHCYKLISLDTSEWDTGKVTKMDRMFAECGCLTSLDVSGWDTSEVTDMAFMFTQCKLLNPLNVSGWDVSNVTDMSALFQLCNSVEVLDVSSWDVHNVTNCGSMFNGCKLVSVLDVSDWDTSSVTDMHSMFCNCESLTILDVSSFKTSQVTDMGYMFKGCAGISMLDVSDWCTSKVTDMSYLFNGCSGLSGIDVSTWDTSCVKKVEYMFYNCKNLTILNLANWDLSSVERMSYMFQNCDNLAAVILGDHTPFHGVDQVKTALPVPPSFQNGVAYTRKWIREDGTFGPYTSEELRDNYTSAMAGTWVWEKVPLTYTIVFVCDEENFVGSMPPVTVVAAEDYELPGNAFRVFGYEFDHWTDGTRRTWRNKDIIPANSYAANTEVTLIAVFEPRNTSVVMEDGKFEFSIKKDEKAFFDNIPAGTSYQVYEQLPEDWVLIYQENSTGLIYPLEESMAIFLNKYQPDVTTVQFTGRKLMNDQAASKDQFEFELREGNILLQTKSTMDGGFFQFDAIEYNKTDVGIHTYTIKEKIGDDDSLLYDGHEEQVTVEIYTEPGETEGSVKVRSNVTYLSDSILFKNWTKPGNLTLQKLVDELLDGHAADEFRFRITFKQENGLPLEEELTYSID